MYKYSCANGSFELSVQDNIVIGVFKGAISARMMAAWVQELTNIVRDHNLTNWGYVGNSVALSAGTPEAQQYITEHGHFLHDIGCRATAYVIHSKIAISQLEKVRKQLGHTSDVHDIVFEDMQQAIDFVEQHIQQ